MLKIKISNRIINLIENKERSIYYIYIINI